MPRAFTVVLLGIGLVYLLDLGSQDVDLIGAVPNGLPSFISPWMGWTVFWSLLPHAVLIAMIAFMEAISISTKLRRDGDNIQPSRELVALGLSNVSAGLSRYSVVGGCLELSMILRERCHKWRVLILSVGGCNN